MAKEVVKLATLVRSVRTHGTASFPKTSTAKQLHRCQIHSKTPLTTATPLANPSAGSSPADLLGRSATVATAAKRSGSVSLPPEATIFHRHRRAALTTATATALADVLSSLYAQLTQLTAVKRGVFLGNSPAAVSAKTAFGADVVSPNTTPRQLVTTNYFYENRELRNRTRFGGRDHCSQERKFHHDAPSYQPDCVGYNKGRHESRGRNCVELREGEEVVETSAGHKRSNNSFLAKYHTQAYNSLKYSQSNSKSGNSTFDFFHGDPTVPQSRKNYAFSHGATGYAKDTKKVLAIEESQRYISIGAGEDAFFVRHDALGVADGVGGWDGTKGANPALYSRKLMHYAYRELEKYDCIDSEEFYDYYNVNPIHILRRSYDLTLRDAALEGVVGSTTACIAVLRDDELRISNLGDCGISVIRHGDFLFRTEEQQHSFNFPFQLGTGSRDTPEDAQEFTIKIQKGDIVIVGSDGMYDNLFDEDILEEVLSSMEPSAEKPPASPSLIPNRISLARFTTTQLSNRTSEPVLQSSASRTLTNSQSQFEVINPQKVSEALARRAKSIAQETRNVSSPFQSRAMQEGMYYQGGKMDDISVVVCQIVDFEDSPDRR